MNQPRRRRFSSHFFINSFWCIAALAFVSYMAFVCLNLLRTELHAVQLRSLGAERVAYGPKGGWFVDLPSGIDPTEFLEKGAYSLDYLSRQHDLTLNLDGTRAEDSDTQYLKKIQGVLRVSLRDTDVSDQGIARLIDMENLKGLDVSNSEVSEKGLHELRMKRDIFPR